MLEKIEHTLTILKGLVRNYSKTEEELKEIQKLALTLEDEVEEMIQLIESLDLIEK